MRLKPFSGVVLVSVISALVCAGFVMPAGAVAAPLPLGTLTLNSDVDSTCPTGHSCQGVQVTCPSVQQPARAFLATAPPTATTRGLVMLMTGGGGTNWWGQQTGLAGPFVDDLRADGFEIVQLRWRDPWLTSAPGEDAGSGHLACRPATVFKWVHDNQFVPLGLAARGVGVCGFCISGNSGGASQVSYALSHYGLESILDAVIPTSGPPHAAQAKGCLQNPSEQAYWYGGAAATIDSSYGFTSGQGPCAQHDASFVPRWNAESVDTGGNDFVHPKTRVHIILGDQDTGSAPPHARDYAARLQAAGSPYVTLQQVANMGHPIMASADGLAALHAALLARAGTYVRPKGATPILVSLVPAFLKCGSPTNRQHGGGLPFDACNPPEVESSYLTVGTPDANGQIAGSNGSLRLDVCPVPGCAAGDVKFHSSISDVRNKDLSSYGGELEGRLVLRITDSLNGPGSNEPATVVDTPFSFPMSCVGVLAPTGGSVCSADTTANAVVPGSVPQGARSIWELGQAEVYDGGADGAASTRSDNTAFMRQGLFIP